LVDRSGRTTSDGDSVALVGVGSAIDGRCISVVRLADKFRRTASDRGSTQCGETSFYVFSACIYCAAGLITVESLSFCCKLLNKNYFQKKSDRGKGVLVGRLVNRSERSTADRRDSVALVVGGSAIDGRGISIGRLVDRSDGSTPDRRDSVALVGVGCIVSGRGISVGRIYDRSERK